MTERSSGDRPTLSVVLPVYNEGEAVEPVLRALAAGVATPHELIVVYDFDEDTTVPVIARLAAELPTLRGHRNELGRGVLNAMKAGIATSRGRFVLISMADGSDEPHIVDSMVALARDGADVVAASRYMRGGRQIGGPPLKRLLSRVAGLTLHWFGGVATHDPTNNFKLYTPAVPGADHDREHGRLRARARAHGQGDARRPARGGGPDDLARSDGGAEQFQAPQVAAALPALVLDRVPRPVPAPLSARVDVVGRGSCPAQPGLVGTVPRGGSLLDLVGEGHLRVAELRLCPCPCRGVWRFHRAGYEEVRQR